MRHYQPRSNKQKGAKTVIHTRKITWVNFKMTPIGIPTTLQVLILIDGSFKTLDSL
jgi:hypothetical protein